LLGSRNSTRRGVIKDPGNPLDSSGKVVRGYSKDVHDGPYAEAKDLVNGYVLIDADNRSRGRAFKRLPDLRGRWVC
jgi:hypothetical protein